MQRSLDRLVRQATRLVGLGVDFGVNIGVELVVELAEELAVVEGAEVLRIHGHQRVAVHYPGYG